MLIRTLIVSLAGALALAACGGGGGGFDAPPPPTVNPNEVPPTATATVASFVNYLDALPRSETGEPLLIDNATPPVSDTAEPLAPT